jgi:hypothetical protein
MKFSYYFFVDGDGTENVSNLPPIRHFKHSFWIVYNEKTSEINYDAIVELPKGTINKLFGKDLTFDDNPIKIEMHENQNIQN